MGSNEQECNCDQALRLKAENMVLRMQLADAWIPKPFNGNTVNGLLLNALQLHRIVEKHKLCDHPEDCEMCGVIDMLRYWIHRHTEASREAERWGKRVKYLENVIDMMVDVGRGLLKKKDMKDERDKRRNTGSSGNDAQNT